MKLFIKKTVIFIAIFLLLGIFILSIFTHFIDTISNDYKIEPGITSIYIGDSHIQKTINDSIIPASINVGISSEALYYSYFKLKMLLTNNPSVDHVYLGCSYHNISNYYDQFVSGHYASVIAPKYFYILSTKEKIKMICWNRKKLASFMKSTIKRGIAKAGNRDRYSFLGGFINQFKKTTAIRSSMDKRLRYQYYTNGNLNPFSELNINYLHKIVSLCKSKGVHITLLNTPIHPYFFNKIPKEYKEKLNEIILTNQLDYIDLSTVKLCEECYVPDGDHVSFRGAEEISNDLIARESLH